MNHSHVGPAKRSREDDLNQSDSLIYDYAEAYNDLSSRVYQWDTPGTASYDSRGIEGQPLDEEEGSVKIEAPDLVKKPSVKRKPPPPLPIPPQGSLVLDKSCSRCRIRKVKCDRIWPRCRNCYERAEECDLQIMKPLPVRPAPPIDIEENRIKCLEERLARLEAGSRPEGQRVGPSSLDWRLAGSEMAISLSRSLTSAFFDSCCSHLPAFTYFRARLADYSSPTPSANSPLLSKSAIAAFCAIGARASPHSALLGIISAPDSNHPLAPLVMAGSRRENACIVLLQQAHTSAFETGLSDEATTENLACLLAMMQMSIFVELVPKKSRSLVRAALGTFKELQDSANTAEERILIKRAFAFALYSGDAVTSAYARKPCLITQSDLAAYFDNVGLVVPARGENLLAVLAGLVGMNQHHTLETATHLLSCWTIAAQRDFARLAARSLAPTVPLSAYSPIIHALWVSIDQARDGIAFIQQTIHTAPSSSTSPTSSAPHHCDHSTDYSTKVTRLDRDLLDVNTMIHILLRSLAPTDRHSLQELIQLSTSRVRRGLKTMAFYAKIFVNGNDRHLIFHHAFQLELNPIWTTLVLQRVGDPDGPVTIDEEVSDIEISWFIEGLQAACYYMPSAEKRLAELSVLPRFKSIDTPRSLSRQSGHSPAYSASTAATTPVLLHAQSPEFSLPFQNYNESYSPYNYNMESYHQH